MRRGVCYGLARGMVRTVSKPTAVIGNLQVLRGVAALGVVFYHTDFRLPGDTHTDFRGVATFFIISGFIMCYISRADPEMFFRRRLQRIVPLYWLCTAVTLALAASMVLRPWRWPPGFLAHLRDSFFFLPADQYPVLGVGWSLNYEMYFYLLFAVALMLHRRLAPLIAGAAVLAVIGLAARGCDHFLCTYYSNGYVKFFVFGIALYYLWATIAPPLPRVPTAVIGSLAILFFYATQFDFGFFDSLFAWSGGAWLDAMPVVIVAAALMMAGAGADIRWRPLIVFGDASYALYLTHTIAMAVLVDGGLLPSPKQSMLWMLAVVVICLAIGIATHLWVEKPLTRWVRSIPWRVPTALAAGPTSPAGAVESPGDRSA